MEGKQIIVLFDQGSNTFHHDNQVNGTHPKRYQVNGMGCINPVWTHNEPETSQGENQGQEEEWNCEP